jgi:hypothetical protein
MYRRMTVRRRLQHHVAHPRRRHIHTTCTVLNQSIHAHNRPPVSLHPQPVQREPLSPIHTGQTPQVPCTVRGNLSVSAGLSGKKKKTALAWVGKAESVQTFRVWYQGRVGRCF